MRVRTVLFICILPAILLLVSPAADARDYLHHSIDAVILVPQPDKAAKQITGRIEELGGYFIVLSSDMVTVRVPAEHAGRLRSFLRSVADEIIEYSPQATDVRDELFAVRSGIESREEILQKNLEYIDKADVAGTLEIEKEIMDLLSEIEELKGRERRLVTDIEYALVHVSLRFKEQTLPDSIPSSFGWINKVDFYSFMTGSFK